MEAFSLNTSTKVVIVEIPYWIGVMDEETQEAILSGKISVPNKKVDHMDEEAYFSGKEVQFEFSAATTLRIFILPWQDSGHIIHNPQPAVPQIMRLSSANFWKDADCDRVWGSSAGAVSCLPEPPRFFLQTPRDGHVFCSFAATMIINKDNSKTCASIVHSSDMETRTSCMRISLIPATWEGTDLPMILVPLEILKRHIQFSTSALEHLINRVQELEDIVAFAKIDEMIFNDIIRKLHSCNTDLIKLQRRWRFENQLSTTIRDFIATYKQPITRTQDVKFINCEFAKGGINTTTKIMIEGGRDETVKTDGVHNDQYFKRIESDSILQSRLNSAYEYDLSVLPRRIANLFTAVFNLIAQRDAKATKDLATTSQNIATLSLRDSSAMKTIAVMTLVFLPATFICSFFSMTFFDWKAAPGDRMSKSLWVYFAVAIPLTIVVITCWTYLIKKKAAEPILPTTDKKSS